MLHASERFRDAFTFVFFGTIVILGVASARKLWGRWKNVFGWSSIVMAFATAQLMRASHATLL